MAADSFEFKAAINLIVLAPFRGVPGRDFGEEHDVSARGWRSKSVFGPTNQ